MPHGCISFGGSPGLVCRSRVVSGGLRPVTFLVVRGPRTDRRSPMPGYVPDEEFARSREVFARAEEWLAGPGAAGLGHAVLEEELLVRGQQIARQLLQDYLDARAAAEPRREQVMGPDGICRRRAERGHARALASVLGPVTVRRIGYRVPGARNAYPADAELGLPAGKHSHGLAKMVAHEAARGSLEQACAQVRSRTGCTLGTRQCQELVRAAAADFGGFYAARPRPAPGAGQVLVLSCDAKGIRMRPGPLPARCSPSPRCRSPAGISSGPVPARRAPGPRASG